MRRSAQTPLPPGAVAAEATHSRSVPQFLPGGKGETTTQGLDGLADRVKAYK
jgi:hypothetical protein